MVDSALLPAIKQALKENEIGSGSPYQIAFAQQGSSGGSFGMFQGDAHTNPVAKATLIDVLTTAGVDAATLNRIVDLVSQACPAGNPLTPEDTAIVDNALSSPAGEQLVDQMDDRTLNVVLGYIDDCAASAATRAMTIEPAAILFIACWVNMTGAPTTLKLWLEGSTENGVAPAAPPSVTSTAIQAYLQAMPFFAAHPRNFATLQASVATAVPLLPSA